MQSKQKFPLRYLVVTFLWSWLLWLPLARSGSGAPLLGFEFPAAAAMAMAVMGAFGPAAGALFSLRTINGRGAVSAYFRRLLDLHFGLTAPLVSILMLTATTFAAWIAPEFFGSERLPMLLPSIIIFPLYWLAMVFFGGGQEEIGWRGYFMPFIEERFGSFGGSLILGLIWALWHLPLWFVPSMNQQYMNFGGFVMLTCGYSLLFSWAMRKAGNRPLLGMILHGTANSLIPVFPVLLLQQNAAQPRYWIWVSLTLAAGLLVTVFGKLSTAPDTASSDTKGE